MEEKPKKTVKIVERERSLRDQLLEQVTETTYRRTRTVQRGHESEGSDDDIGKGRKTVRIQQGNRVDILTEEVTGTFQSQILKIRIQWTFPRLNGEQWSARLKQTLDKVGRKQDYWGKIINRISPYMHRHL